MTTQVSRGPQSQGRHYQVISGDGHLEGPVDWTKWVASKYQDAVPNLVTREDGSQVWRTDYAGVRSEFVVGSNLYCGLRYDEFTPERARTYFNPDGSLRPGCGDATQRLREQDLDGIDAEVLFFGGGLSGAANKFKDRDREVTLALVQGYNDHLADYCSIAPDRLIGNCILPQTGVDDAIAEMERCRKLGLRTNVLQQWPNGSGNPKPEDDRFWAASLNLGMRISPHANFGAGTPPPHEIVVTPEASIQYQMNGGRPCAMTIGQMIYHGVFDRFPNLRIYFAEAQGGWLAPHMDFADEFYQRWYTYHNIKLKKQPSQYIRDHCMFSFIHDRMAMALRKYIGVDILMWGSDFPHSVGTFPESRAILDELFEDVPEVERHQVLVGNVCDFFGLAPEKPLTSTPA